MNAHDYPMKRSIKDVAEMKRRIVYTYNSAHVFKYSSQWMMLIIPERTFFSPLLSFLASMYGKQLETGSTRMYGYTESQIPRKAHHLVVTLVKEANRQNLNLKMLIRHFSLVYMNKCRNLVTRLHQSKKFQSSEFRGEA